jgi:hypothetical protein
MHRISCLLTIVRKYLGYSVSQLDLSFVAQSNLTEIPRGEFLCDRHLCVCVMESAEVEMWVEVERLINNSSKASANAQREIRRGWFEVRMSHRRGSEASKVVLCWEGDWKAVILFVCSQELRGVWGFGVRAVVWRHDLVA